MTASPQQQQEQQQQGPDLSAVDDLMGLVVRRPGVLFLSEQAVKGQLEDIQVSRCAETGGG